jgi:hypothetical protein
MAVTATLQSDAVGTAGGGDVVFLKEYKRCNLLQYVNF